MGGDEVVDGLAVRTFEVSCWCGQCPEPVKDVLMVAVPGEDRWALAGTVTSLSWPDGDVPDEEREVIVDLALRLVALFGMPWAELNDQTVMQMAFESMGLREDPLTLGAVLAKSLEELRDIGGRLSTVQEIRAAARHQAATS